LPSIATSYAHKQPLPLAAPVLTVIVLRCKCGCQCGMKSRAASVKTMFVPWHWCSLICSEALSKCVVSKRVSESWSAAKCVWLEAGVLSDLSCKFGGGLVRLRRQLRLKSGLSQNKWYQTACTPAFACAALGCQLNGVAGSPWYACETCGLGELDEKGEQLATACNMHSWKIKTHAVQGRKHMLVLQPMTLCCAQQCFGLTALLQQACFSTTRQAISTPLLG
jgi:hypothetical protein